MLLSAIAARTRRVRLGTCCLSTFPLRDPIFLAAQWAALDQVSHGRTILGACIGGSLPREKAEAEFAAFKVKLSERAPRLEEGITILRRLWTEDHVTHAGRVWEFRDLTLEPKPVQKPCPPIWIATNPKPGLAPPHVVDRARRRVGLMADGWMTDNTPVATFKQRWELIRQVAREAGRSTEQMESALHLMININDDRGAAFEESVKFLHTYYSPAMTREYIEGWLVGFRQHFHHVRHVEVADVGAEDRIEPRVERVRAALERPGVRPVVGLAAEVERRHEEIVPVLLLRDLAGRVVVEISEAAGQARGDGVRP